MLGSLYSFKRCSLFFCFFLCPNTIITANHTGGAGAKIRQSVASGQGDPMVACYIDSGFPAMLFMVHKYADADLATVACANANAGGENVARGSVLGAVLGARPGGLGSAKGWLEEGLVDGAAITEDIEGAVCVGQEAEETKEQSGDPQQRTNL